MLELWVDWKKTEVICTALWKEFSSSDSLEVHKNKKKKKKEESPMEAPIKASNTTVHILYQGDAKG